jgi:hypothetical protein
MPEHPHPDQNDPVVALEGKPFMVSSTLMFRDERTGLLYDLVHVLRGFVNTRIRIVIHKLGG